MPYSLSSLVMVITRSLQVTPRGGAGGLTGSRSGTVGPWIWDCMVAALL